MDCRSSSIPPKIRLCLAIIEEHFGNITRDVAFVISKSDNATLAYVVRYFYDKENQNASSNSNFKNDKNKSNKLSVLQIKHAMLVLQQHNCLNVNLPHEVDVEEDTLAIATDRLKMKGLIYSINFDFILHRLHLPKIISMANKLYGDTGMMIMEELIIHGRLKINQICDDVEVRLKKRVETDDSQQQNQSSCDHDESNENYRSIIRNIFELMIQRRLIIPVPSLDIKKRLLERQAKNVKTLEAKTKKSNQESLGNTKRKRSAGTDGKETARPQDAKKPYQSSKEAVAQDIPMELRLMLQSEQEDSDNKLSTNESAPQSIIVRSATNGRSRGRGRGRGMQFRGNTNDDNIEVNSVDLACQIGGKDTIGNGLSELENGNFGPREDILWTVGWDQYIREERHNSCIEFTITRMELLAGAIVRVMLDHSLSSESGPTDSRSVPIGIMKIHSLLRAGKGIPQTRLDLESQRDSCGIKAENGNGHRYDNSNPSSNHAYSTIDIATLRKMLDLLRFDAVNMVTKVQGSDNEVGGPYYMVNMDVIIAACQRRCVHSIAVERHGILAGRIIELLHRHRYLDQQRISDMTISPPKDARDLLYKLHRDKWVDYYEITRRPDFTPAATSYFWYINVTNVLKVILDHLFVSLHHLKLRRAHEYEQGRSLVEFTITDANEAKKFDAFTAALDTLDKSIVMLDKSILLLRYF